MKRSVNINRNTNETKIKLNLDLNGKYHCKLDTKVPFLEHMLDQLARHGMLSLVIKADGDVQIDDHHTVEDIAIVLGQAFKEALGDKKGIKRFAYAYAPLDEALSRAVVDISGRGHLDFNVEFTRATIGNFETELVREFFQAFANNAGITLHLDNIKGINSHHICESVFKAFALALGEAISLDEKKRGVIPSTKGSL